MRVALTLAAALSALSPALAGEPAPVWASLKLDDLQATRERPLFTPGRRPPPPPAEAPALAAAPPPPPPPPPAPPEPPPFEMVGAAVGDLKSYVLLRKRASGEVVRLRSGESAEGWRVGAVALRSVVLERDGRAETIAIAAPAAAMTGPTPLAQAAPPGADPGDNPPEVAGNVRILPRRLRMK